MLKTGEVLGTGDTAFMMKYFENGDRVTPVDIEELILKLEGEGLDEEVRKLRYLLRLARLEIPKINWNIRLVGFLLIIYSLVWASVSVLIRGIILMLSK